MSRTEFGWCAAVVCLLGFSGCSMCCHPYDKCGPVYSDGCDCCSTNMRAGSRFAPRPESMPVEMAQKSPSHQKTTRIAQRQPKPGYVPGSEKIISVTERVVGPALDEDDSSVAAAKEPTGDQSSESLPSSGWTARRPTEEVVR